MKFSYLTVTLLFCFLVHLNASHGPQNSISLKKPAYLMLSEVAAQTNRILDSIRYLQLYDVVEQKAIFPVTATVTLYDIEFKNLAVTKKADLNKLKFNITNGKFIINDAPGFDLAIGAQVSLKWKYHISMFDVYKGSATAVLKSSAPKLEFTFEDGTPNWTGKLSFGFALDTVVSTGFGASKLVNNHIIEMFNAKMVSTLNEEVNRYNDLIVDFLKFEGFYRNMKAPVEISKDLVLQNSFAKFYVCNITNSLGFIFSSAVYDPLKHEKVSIDAEFTPACDPNLTKEISVIIGSKAMRHLVDAMQKGTIMTEYELTPDNFTTLFGYPLNVRMLSNFYPPLLDRFSPELTVNLSCATPKVPGVPSDFIYSCIFRSSADGAQIMKIPKLVLQTEFKVLPNGTEATTKTIGVGMQDFHYTDITLEVFLNKPLKKEFLAFLQPMALWLQRASVMTFDIVGKEMTWKYLRANVTSNYTALIYDY